MASTVFLRLLFLLCSSCCVAGDLLYVSPSGVNIGNTCASLDHPCATISYAVSQASSGSTISLGSGKYRDENSLNIDQPLSFVTTSGLPDVVVGGPAKEAIFIFTGTTCTIDNIELDGEGQRRHSSCIILTTSTLSLTGVTIHDCITTSFTAGGGITLDHASLLTIDDCAFTNNSAINGSSAGGAIYSSGMVNANNCTFTGNSGKNAGGAIYNLGGGALSVDDCAFARNNAFIGGAIFNAGGSKIDVNNCSFVTNSGLCGGGAVYSMGTALVNASLFTDNPSGIGSPGTCGGGGGAIYSYGEDLTVDRSSFVRNEAWQGGAVSIIQGPTRVNNCTFEENFSSNQGGAIYVARSLDVDVNASSFVQNIAKSQGGAIFTAGKVKVSSSSFVGNAAASGGVIYFDDSGKGFDANDCLFANNVASEDGGAIYSIGAEMTATDCSFTNNTASYGGAIFTDKNAILNLQSCMLDGNAARVNGGAIFDFGKATASDCIIAYNSAESVGGGVYFGVSASWNSILFDCNQAKNGTDSFEEDCTFTCTDCEYRNCTECTCH